MIQITILLPHLKNGAQWQQALEKAAEKYGINTVVRQQMFLANVIHESEGLTALVENLNYSAAALMATWPKHFDSSNAHLYERQPEKIGNRAYADRMGNGDEASGDGWKYRGRGLMQETGKGMYIDLGVALCGDRNFFVNNPDLLELPEWAAMAAAWTWQQKGCNALADAGNFNETVHRINGGYNGLADRQGWLARIQKGGGANV